MIITSEAEVAAVHGRLQQLSALAGVREFHERAPELLAGLVSADHVVLNLLGPDAEVLATTVHGMPMPSWVPEIWPSHAPTHPVALHMRRTRDPAPRTVSDFWSARRLRGTGLYAEVFAPLDVEDQLCVYADPGADGVLGVTFNRGSRSFGDRDRRLAGLLSAGLTCAYAAIRTPAVAGVETLGLTPRQGDVLRHLASGASYVEVGRRMGITVATVRTHVERLYGALGVRSRGEAVALLLHPPGGSAPLSTLSP